jgi:hypothetical protein
MSPRASPVLLMATLLALGACNGRGLPAAGDASADDSSGTSDAAAAYAEQVIRACVVATGCSPPSSQATAIECLWRFVVDRHLTIPSPQEDAELAGRVLTCASTHGGDDCDGFHACYGGTWATLAICRAQAACQGTRLVHTSEPALYFDCASLGASCIMRAPPATPPACCSRPCAQGTIACDSSTRGTFCSDPALGIRFECGWGTACRENLGCGGTGEPCSGQVCLGPTVVRYCEGGPVTYDCRDNFFFGACGKDPHLLPCEAAGRECDPWDLQTTCQGDKLVLCVNGYERKLDCKAFGFKGCHAAVARCAN